MLVYHLSEVDVVRTVFEKLPVVHLFADAYSVLEDGSALKGPDEHNAYLDRKTRRAARTRSVVFETTIRYVGGYGPIPRKRTPDCPVLACFASVPDWCDMDDGVFTESILNLKIGSLPFNAYEYMRIVIEDVCCAFKAIKNSCSDRVWLKIAPLAMGPSIQTKENAYVSPIASFWYAQAISIAINEHVRDSWVHTLEIIDLTGLLHSLQLNVPKVRVILPSVRDILDFRGCPGNIMPACIVPVDSFSRPWANKTTLFDSLATCVCNNTDISKDSHDPVFVKSTLQ